MSLLSIFLIAVGLGMDTFAVSIGVSVSARRFSLRRMLRLSFHFGLFQFIMPILGWLAGRTVYDYIAAYDHWIAFFLLAFIGGRMIHGAFRQEETVNHNDPTKGASLVVLSIATSIDALAVGLSFAVLDMGIICPSVIIGIVTFIMTAVGMVIGDTLGRIGGKSIEIAGGLILIGIGVKIVLEHLL